MTETEFRLRGVDTICFDAFGTLVEIADPKSTGRRLLKLAPSKLRATLRRRLMTEERNLATWPKVMGFPLDPLELSSLSADLEAEVASVRLRPTIGFIWQTLKGQGRRLGICSNLAPPFGPSVLAVLPSEPEFSIFSYQVGQAKPEPGMYQRVIAATGVAPQHILFVGDTRSADIDGPKAAGMQAMHISVFQQQMSG